MKRIIAVWLVVVLVLSLSGCGAKSDATKAFDAMMTAFKSGEKEKIAPYYDFEATAEHVVANNKEELEQEILKTLKKMDYKVISGEKVDNNQVKLKVEVTTLDFSEVMNRFIAKVMELVSAEDYQARVGSMSQEEYQSLLAEQMMTVLNQEDIPTVQETLEVTMEKESGNWKLGGSKTEFLNAVFANLIQVVTSLV